MDIVTIVVGLIMPPVVSYIKSVKWSREIRVLASMAVCTAVAVVALAAQGDLKAPSDVFEKATQVWAVSQAEYALWFGSTSLNKKIERMGVK